jgi:hypothetical protein
MVLERERGTGWMVAARGRNGRKGDRDGISGVERGMARRTRTLRRCGGADPKRKELKARGGGARCVCDGRVCRCAGVSVCCCVVEVVVER